MVINLKYVVYTDSNITLKQPFQLKALLFLSVKFVHTIHNRISQFSIQKIQHLENMNRLTVIILIPKGKHPHK